MKVREFITLLADIGANADIREYDVRAFDPNAGGIEDVTGVTWSPRTNTIIIETDG